MRRHIPGLGLDGTIVSYAGPGTTNAEWLLADERGSVIALTDGLGAAFNINRYDDYGVPAAGNMGRFQYTGQQWLEEAGAYHYRARTYLPQTGRFLQTDPIGYAAGANLYAYVGADPVNMVDPLGLAPLVVGEDTTEENCWAEGGRVGNNADGKKVCFVRTGLYWPGGVVGGFAPESWGGFTCSASSSSDNSIGNNIGAFGQGLGDAFSFLLYSNAWASIPGSLGEMYRDQTELQSYDNGMMSGTAVSLARIGYAGIATTFSRMTGRNAVAARNSLKQTFALNSSHPRTYSYEQLLAKYGSDSAVAAAARTNMNLNAAATSTALSGSVQQTSNDSGR